MFLMNSYYIFAVAFLHVFPYFAVWNNKSLYVSQWTKTLKTSAIRKCSVLFKILPFLVDKFSIVGYKWSSLKILQYVCFKSSFKIGSSYEYEGEQCSFGKERNKECYETIYSTKN